MPASSPREESRGDEHAAPGLVDPHRRERVLHHRGGAEDTGAGREAEDAVDELVKVPVQHVEGLGGGEEREEPLVAAEAVDPLDERIASRQRRVMLQKDQWAAVEGGVV